MTWTRFSDNFLDRPDLDEVSNSALLLHIRATIYCNKHLTDGALSATALRRHLSDRSEDVEHDASELVEAGLWEVTETGYQVNWDDQEKADKVRERQRLTEERKARFVQKRAAERVRNASENASENALQDAFGTVPRPDPARPGPTHREGKGKGGANATRSTPLRSARSRDRASTWDPIHESTKITVDWSGFEASLDDDDTGEES